VAAAWLKPVAEFYRGRPRPTAISTHHGFAAAAWLRHETDRVSGRVRTRRLLTKTLVPDEPISVGTAADTPVDFNYDGRFKGLIPMRQALAESRNAVAIWITEQRSDRRVLRTARRLGIRTPLRRYATTALGASEVNLLELATAYRTIASGVLVEPYVIKEITRESGDVVDGREHRSLPIAMADGALALIQEGLRGVVRIPAGTAHALDSQGFPIAVLGKSVRRATSEMHCSWARRTASTASRSPSGSASTTVVRSAPVKPAGEWHCRCSRS
jgi:hypothetical protein